MHPLDHGLVVRISANPRDFDAHKPLDVIYVLSRILGKLVVGRGIIGGPVPTRHVVVDGLGAIKDVDVRRV